MKLHMIDHLINSEFIGNFNFSLNNAVGNKMFCSQGLSAAELEASEGNDGEESYSSQLTQEEVGEINTSEGELMRTSNESDIMTTDGEIVGELVMDNNDPSVIVESIVNTDGSVFVDERDFNSYCEDSLSHAVDESQSPKRCGIILDFFILL